jgi:hypothetical protein
MTTESKKVSGGGEAIPSAGFPDPSDATIAFVDRITGHRAEITQAKFDGVETHIADTAKAHRDLVDTQIRAVRAEVFGAVTENATRLNAMDKAAEVLAATVNEVPSKLQLTASEITATMVLRFQGVEDHFNLVDKATERQRHDAELAASALARTQERATAALALASNEAIKRSDEHTAEKILKNEQSQLQGQKTLSDKIDVADQRMNRLEQALGELRAAAVGANANRDNTRNNTTLIFTGLGVFAAVLAIIVTIVLTRPSSSPSDTTVVDPGRSVTSTVTVTAP